MLHLTLSKAFKRKGITKGHKFLKDLGFNPNKASELNRDKTTVIRVDELEKICHALWCTPNDLFGWEPDSKFPALEGHPINLIKLRDEELDLASMGKTLTIDQLRVLNEQARQMAAQNREEIK